MAFIGDSSRPNNIWVVSQWDAFMLRFDKIATSPYLARLFAEDEIISIEVFTPTQWQRIGRHEFDSANEMRCALNNIIKEKL